MRGLLCMGGCSSVSMENAIHSVFEVQKKMAVKITRHLD